MISASIVGHGGGAAKLQAAVALAPVLLHAYKASALDFDREGPADSALEGLAGSRAARRFRAWTGGSGRRYVFSVFPLGAGAADLDRLPLDQEAVVIAGVRAPDGTLHPIWIDIVGGLGSCWRSERSYRTLASRRDCELHVHLLAADHAERQAVARDLGAP